MLDYNRSLSKGMLKFSGVDNLGDGCNIRIIHYVKRFIYKMLIHFVLYLKITYKLC